MSSYPLQRFRAYLELLQLQGISWSWWSRSLVAPENGGAGH